MSSQQLNRLNTEKEKLLRERDRTKDITKVSEACETLINYTKSTLDPFAPDWHGGNQWLSSPDAQGCACLIE